MSDAPRRNRMLRLLAGAAPAVVAVTPLDDLLDVRGFGAAMTYECADWLREHGLTNEEIADWIGDRLDAGHGDPRTTRDPEDYTYDSQTQRVPYA